MALLWSHYGVIMDSLWTHLEDNPKMVRTKIKGMEWMGWG